ncbi:helicase-exonuclease AddAB subunit AddB [Mangrovibacillus cuniculi]|uniref:ATP-dependent helicase/deoxyribonuclease subunit B n=1 Tax=Mangrovibacillus cuniculi TaxID=2593652 RepID=A0A7S8C9T8_9BACI|nr:helicase-exonuclease AddAB subunit AddB [Mangrovibacillus cuniculi]QPC46023.1 helicase-exonuclease AddAB subunit AddB [Mangrovibacillus cuniculi]
MGLTLHIGRSGTGKSTKTLKEIAALEQENPIGPSIIYLVPDQMTFQSEQALIEESSRNGMIRTQVLSFTRLAYRVLQETGKLTRYHVNSVGLAMFIRKVMEDKREEITLFRKVAGKPGFVQHVETLLTEFRRYCVEAEDLDQLKQKALDGGNKALSDKLSDLALMFAPFNALFEEHYIDSEDYFKWLVEGVKESAFLQDAIIFIDGFDSFTPQEFQILEQLLIQCKEVSISLTLDRSMELPVSPLEPFRMTGETFAKLTELCMQNGVPYQLVKEENQYRAMTAGIKHVEEQFLERPAISTLKKDGIQLIQAANRRVEIENVARLIRQEAKEHGVRYREMAILVRNQDAYQELLETILKDYDIPFFIDQKRPMLHHPLIELLRSTIDILRTNWSYEAVFRAVKTDLLFPLDRSTKELRHQMDLLENYVLAYGIKGRDWTKKDRWLYRNTRGLELTNTPQTSDEKEHEQLLNELRLTIMAPIVRLAKRWKQATLGSEKAEVFYLFLEEIDAPAKLDRLRITAEENGDLVHAREHEQAWNAVMELFDQFVEIFGEQELTVETFADMMDAGMASMKFSLVPPSIDQVIVANMETSRLRNIHTAFVIGVNDGVLPAKWTDDGLLSDSEREWFQSVGVAVSPTTTVKLADEEYIAYKTFSLPTNNLVVSYSMANEEGKPLLPSLYIKRLKELFPSLEEEMILGEPFEAEEKQQFSYLSHPGTAIPFVTSALQFAKRGYQIHDLWWEAARFYTEDTAYRVPAQIVFRSLAYQNKALPLSEETATKLYGEEIQASVTRMELFNSCPFSHFARHGLRLRERQYHRLEAPNIGELFHGALKYIADQIQANDLSWASLSKKQIDKLSVDAVSVLSPRLQHQILLSSKRYEYIRYKLQEIVKRASYTLTKQAQSSGFAPVGLEIPFGPNKMLSTDEIPLINGKSMVLRGQIDRVDKAEKDGKVYVRIVDFKSSKKDLDLTEVYYGISLQMLTYLDMMIEHGKPLVGEDVTPAGMLYFHMQNPLVKTKSFLTEEEIEEALLKEFKMKGYVLDDHEVVDLMDQSLEQGSSLYVPIGKKKDGSLTAASKVTTKMEMNSLRSHVHRLYQESGTSMTNGEVNITPYKLKEKIPCTFCSYKSVCQFDHGLEENEYRNLSALSNKEVLKKMVEGESAE